MTTSKCIVAHPDDEVIFMGPLLRSKKSIIELNGHFPCPHSLRITKVACITCQNDDQRASEFKKICEYYECDSSIYNAPIIRSIFNSHVRDTWANISGELNKQTDICITHSLYGDDHFHPQHILVSIICLTICLARGIPIIFSHTSKSYKWLVRLALTRTEFTFKSLSFLVIKLVMIGLTKLITQHYLTARADQIDLDNANEIYTSQSLGYVNVIENMFSFQVLRPILKNGILKNEFSFL